MAKAAAKYWLIKSEPGTFSIDDLKKARRECWDGVRNYQARNHMRDMRVGDLALFYHSNADPPGVAGVARVCREAYPDHTQFDKRSKYYDAKAKKDEPRWYMVDFEFVEKLPELVPLETLKNTKALDGMLVIRRGMRLSVQPVEKKHFERVRRLGGA
jgi:predicted RNA-binding protein with PUA-like domain